MIKAEFGIIDTIDKKKDYSDYEPEKYHCIAICDDYIDDWWNQLTAVKTYFYCLDRPDIALTRFGVALIPPESLPAFQKIILQDKRIDSDERLVDLANLIQRAIDEKKFIVHYGV